jgi:hypothetical protein
MGPDTEKLLSGRGVCGGVSRRNDEGADAEFVGVHLPKIAGRRGHECADGLDIAEHENRKERARILDAGKRSEIMRTGCDVHHGCWVRTDARGVGLGGYLLVGCGSWTRQVAGLGSAGDAWVSWN